MAKEQLEEIEPITLDNPREEYKYEDKQPILSVKHLKQYFQFGRGQYKYTKAVHDISFDIYKGEVFGLVGESGCGKTTTGRSIIKLYKITSGDVIFNGIRIAAGTRWNEKEIKFTNKRLYEFLKQSKLDEKAELNDIMEKMMEERKSAISEEDVKAKFEPYIKEIKAKHASARACKIAEAKIINERERQRIRDAKHDDRHCNDDIVNQAVKEVKTKYAHLFTEDGRKALRDKNHPNHEAYQNDLLLYRGELKEAKQASITRKMQMIFQDPIASLNPRMTVRNIIAEGLIIKGVKDKEFIDKEVKRVLELVGLLPEHANRYPHEFSGGQRQRIGIARAIIMNPELIIADEPVSALDVSIQAQVINLLNDLRNDLGLTILFIAHNLSVVKYFCDRIAVMYYGSLMEVATSEELFAHPLHPYTRSLLSAVPHPDPNIEKGRKRVTYNPELDHDYSKQAPTLREIRPGHFVRCNDEEEARYLEEISLSKKEKSSQTSKKGAK